MYPDGLSGLGKATVRLSSGQYGLAMSWVAIHPEAIRLLCLSKKFRRMADLLDRAYVDDRYWNYLKLENPSSKLDNNFRIAGGSLKGRRLLYVDYDDDGSHFSPAGRHVFDVISFKTSLSGGGPIPWVEDVAHETAHAFARVRARGRGPSTAVQRVRAAVLDECNTRKVVQLVVAEIRATKAGAAALAEYPPPAPVRMCDCERDWFPVAQKRTYLEQFVLGMDWELATRKLDSTQIEKVTKDVAAIPLLNPSGQEPSIFLLIMRGGQIDSFAKQFPVLQSPAGQAAFVLRLVDESWRQLIGKLGENSYIWRMGAKELRLQRHARLFFRIPVSYTTPCP